MIKSFKHKGIEKFYRQGSLAGIQARHKKRLKLQLSALDTATEIEDLDIPGYRLHCLKGSREGTWSITVSANWRLTFQFIEGNVHVLNYEDYH